MTFIEYLHKQIKERSDAIAVKSEEASLTYDELDKYSNLVRESIPSKKKVVAVYTEQVPEIISMIVGIVKSGAAFMVIDKEFPLKRIEYMLNNSECNTVIYNDLGNDEKLEKLKQNNDITFVDYKNCLKGKLQNSKEVCRKCTDIQYIVYTSGTTGNPKGVMVTDENLANYIQWFISEFALTNDESSIVVSSLAFDLGYSNVFPVLAVGGTVNLLKKTQYISPVKAINYIKDNAVTFMKCTPSYFNLMMNYNDTGILDFGEKFRFLVLGGENLKIKDVSKFIKDNPNIRVINHYGPTETTIGIAFSEISDLSLKKYKEKPFVGYLIINTEVFIKDDYGVLHDYEDCKKNHIKGELCIQSKSTSAGYINNKELTNEKFIVNGGHKGKIYCTGDIVHIENDGLINIMGREDSQVKINGYRVEVNEIKNIMLEFASIDFAEIDVEDQDIIAYIKESKNIEYDELYDFLGERLSTYMLPKRIYVVKKIALTLNGKIDFKIMKKSGKLLQSNNPITKPETDMEKALYKLWKQLLNCEEEFSIEDNFFSVGGTSILGIELLSYLNLDNFEYQDLLENSSIKKLACVIEMKKGSIKEIDELKMPDCLTDYVDKKEVRYMVKPFNKVYYEDCIYNAIFSAFDYFNIELRYFLSHELPTLDESNFIFKRDNNMVKIDCHINKVYGEDFIKGDFVGNSNVIDKIRTALLNKNIPIVRIDCYYEKYRKEFYNKSHFMHALCITGFNDFEKKLYALEHSNVNSLDYKEIEISYQEVINANFAYEYFTGYTRESYYEVSKIKDSSYLQKDPVRDFVQYICKHKSVLKKNISKTNVVMVEGKFALDNTELFSDRLIQMRIFLKMEIFKAELLVDDEQVKNPIIESNKIFEKMFQIVLVKKMRKQSLDLTETDKSNMKYALTLLREYFSKLLKWADNKVEEMSTNNKEIKILENRIKELFYQVTNIDQDIDVNRKLTDYGINSITIIEFLVKIEDEFDIEFDIENMTVEKFESLHDLCDYVQSNSQNLDNCKTY